ncbi:MAG TPA: SGNH/GDSL hydrolase family protein [Thermoanaerobaculia bacterium]
MQRFIRTVWTLAAITPLYALIQQWNGRRAIALVLLYIAGWIAIAAGLRRDRGAERLGEFFSGRFAAALAWIGFVLLQLALVLYPGHWLSFLLIAGGAWFLWMWALAPGKFPVLISRQLALAISILAILFALEGALRFAASRRPRNDFQNWTWGHQVHHNRFGFRERDFEPVKPANVYRVMVLGDSLTWGAGLSEEQRYTNLAESYLANRGPKRIEMLNFGIPGGPTTQERDILRQYIGEVDPDRIVVGFCINDPQPQRQDYAVEIERYRNLFRLTHVIDAVGFTDTAKFLNEGIADVLRATGRVPQWPVALGRTYQKNSPEWKAFVQALADIKAMSDARHLPPPIIMPLLYGRGDFAKPNAELALLLEWTREAADAARSAGFEVVNLEPDFMTQGVQNRWVNKWDSHPSRECNVIYARRLADAIVRTTYK